MLKTMIAQRDLILHPENAFRKEKRVIMKYSYTLMHATCCKVILDHAYSTNTYTVYFG